MRSEDLGDLEWNLTQSNFHTVLGVELANYKQPDLSPYYYGAQGVVVVRISGQLKLLTDWVRGRFIEGEGRDDEGTWSESFKPLIPEEVLITGLPEAALRDCDKERVQKFIDDTKSGKDAE